MTKLRPERKKAVNLLIASAALLVSLGSAASWVFWGTADANSQARGLQLARNRENS